MNQTSIAMSSSGSRTKSIKQVALLGYGVVGQGLYEIIEKQKDSQVEIQGISIKNEHKERNIPQRYFNNTSTELIQNTEIESIVEVTDDPEYALKMLMASSHLEKNFISANKRMVAANLAKIIKLRKAGCNAILYEASVAAAIPVIRLLETYFREEPIFSLRGIINGSSNYILSKIFVEGLGFDEALGQAIKLGFAESDPEFDINGSDVQSKLIILALHAFGVLVNEDEVFYTGIQNLKQSDIDFAKSKNGRIKLLAKGFQDEDGQTSLYVIPTLVTGDDTFWNINDEQNAIEIEGKYSGFHLFSGKGAGAYPTASALLSDLYAANRGFKYEYAKYHEKHVKRLNATKVVEVYVRFSDPAQFNANDFQSIHFKNTTDEGLIVEGKIKLESLLSGITFRETSTFIMEIIS